MKVITETCRVH